MKTVLIEKNTNGDFYYYTYPVVGRSKLITLWNRFISKLFIEETTDKKQYKITNATLISGLRHLYKRMENEKYKNNS